MARVLPVDGAAGALPRRAGARSRRSGPAGSPAGIPGVGAFRRRARP